MPAPEFPSQHYPSPLVQLLRIPTLDLFQVRGKAGRGEFIIKALMTLFITALAFSLAEHLGAGEGAQFAVYYWLPLVLQLPVRVKRWRDIGAHPLCILFDLAMPITTFVHLFAEGDTDRTYKERNSDPESVCTLKQYFRGDWGSGDEGVSVLPRPARNYDLPRYRLPKPVPRPRDLLWEERYPAYEFRSGWAKRHLKALAELEADGVRFRTSLKGHSAYYRLWITIPGTAHGLAIYEQRLRRLFRPKYQVYCMGCDGEAYYYYIDRRRRTVRGRWRWIRRRLARQPRPLRFLWRRLV